MMKLKYYNLLYKVAFNNWKEMYLLEKANAVVARGIPG